MTDKVFTFWDGDKMPAYIKLCMETWSFPYTLLTFDNLHEYTDLPITDGLCRFSLPQISDCIRVHVLRDRGGYWLDADTIMLTDSLPEATILGDPEARTNSIGFLRSEPHADMFEEWAQYQDKVISDPDASCHWAVMGNMFTDAYLKRHPEIVIGSIEDYCPETYIIPGDITRYRKYLRFYFDTSYQLYDIYNAGMLMLHNSWTPNWFKALDADGVNKCQCTLANILREARKKFDMQRRF